MTGKKEWKEKAQCLVDELEELIDVMPYKGDSCDESQKVCLKQALNEFEYNINGLTDEDFMESNDDEL